MDDRAPPRGPVICLHHPEAAEVRDPRSRGRLALSRITSAALTGVDGVPVEIEVRISSLLPRVDIVGLPEAAVRESSARVRAAISSAGQRFPERRVTVNLAPAELRKSGAALDLPIAIGILAASATISGDDIAGLAFIGELALDGRLRGIRGALALVIACRDAGCRAIVVPEANAREAALAPGIRVYEATSLREVLCHITGAKKLAAVESPRMLYFKNSQGPCLSEVRGQEGAKRALQVAAAGGHAVLLSGPPGSGKTMLARRLPGLLPALDFESALEATRIHGAAGRLDERHPIVTRRPFRAPHHTASTAGLMGGGNPPRPGEVSLAHRASSSSTNCQSSNGGRSSLSGRCSKSAASASPGRATAVPSRRTSSWLRLVIRVPAAGSEAARGTAAVMRPRSPVIAGGSRVHSWIVSICTSRFRQ